MRRRQEKRWVRIAGREEGGRHRKRERSERKGREKRGKGREERRGEWLD